MGLLDGIISISNFNLNLSKEKVDGLYIFEAFIRIFNANIRLVITFDLWLPIQTKPRNNPSFVVVFAVPHKMWSYRESKENIE